MSTIWVIYQMVGPMKHTYEANKGLDSLNIILLLVPCGVLAALVHPPGTAFGVVRTLWAFSSYVEAVSILPQIYMFQVRWRSIPGWSFASRPLRLGH